MRRWLRKLRCRLRWCPGHVVGGIRDGVAWVGWRCDDCRRVKHYDLPKKVLAFELGWADEDRDRTVS